MDYLRPISNSQIKLDNSIFKNSFRLRDTYGGNSIYRPRYNNHIIRLISFDKLRERGNFRLKDPASAITHLIGMILAIIFMPAMVYKASTADSFLNVFSVTVFMLSMIALYAASTTYHSYDISPSANKLLKKLDHSMISVLIAGSYTPICLVALHNTIGYVMLGIVWGLAFIAIAFKLLWVTCPKWISSCIYLIMGWTCVMAFPQILAAVPFSGFMWLLVGGIMYSVGAIIYALKPVKFNMAHPNFGSHEIFHLFVMAGSLCHYIMIFNFVANM